MKKGIIDINTSSRFPDEISQKMFELAKKHMVKATMKDEAIKRRSISSAAANRAKRKKVTLAGDKPMKTEEQYKQSLLVALDIYEAFEEVAAYAPIKVGDSKSAFVMKLCEALNRKNLKIVSMDGSGIEPIAQASIPTHLSP